MTRHSESLMRGGLVHRLLRASGAMHGLPHLPCWIAAGLLLVSTLPLLLLCASAGTLWPHPPAMALLGDYATLARLLLATPVLILAAAPADALMRNAFRQLGQHSLVPPRRQPRLQALLRQIRHGRDGWWPEALCVLIAWAPALLDSHAVSLLPGIADWRLDGAHLTAAGRWYEWVSLPLHRLILLLWLWRFALWTYLLWRLPRVGMVLRPQHPDGAGGLGFLGLAQERFAVLSLSSGLLLGGACLNHMTYLGEGLHDMRHLLAGFVIGATALLVAPLLLLMPAMLRAKRHGLYRFDALGSRAAETFDRRWKQDVGSRDDSDSLLDHGDASALADFSGVYHGLASMSVMPLNRWNLVWMTIPAMLPLCPVFLVAMSVDELASKLLGILA
ncbi:hypothetical protein ACLB90_00725 [Stenotrophomonas sp. LGBM10]|uniref:hypothetical protein n=1 Tax=Stenotrophomonas sp. LGBM10 TaxID=3390038 RepID=UPI00398B3D8C